MLLVREDMSDNLPPPADPGTDSGGGCVAGHPVSSADNNQQPLLRKQQLKIAQIDGDCANNVNNNNNNVNVITKKRSVVEQSLMRDSGGGGERGAGVEQRRSFAGITANEDWSSSSCMALRRAVSTLNHLDDFISEKIGAGFFSEVFKVTHRVNGEIMVLKKNTNSSNRNNMIREIQLMNRLSHPNILKYYGACVESGQLHALTEHMSGGSLEQLLCNKSIDLPWVVRVGLAKDIASGMNYLHLKGFLHRDLTSKNILIRRTKDGYTGVVADFGLAEKIPIPHSQRLPIVGSPYWMAPECLRGEWYNEKADVFSYGIILCEIIARIEADPDFLPRLENFGLDVESFKLMCPDCPAEFFNLAVKCSHMNFKCRPSFLEIKEQLKTILKDLSKPLTYIKTVGQSDRKSVNNNRRSLSEDDLMKLGEMYQAPCSPSDKARCHFSPIGSGYSDPQAATSLILQRKNNKSVNNNPFAKLDLFSNGKKILPSSKEQFSSCLELQSPSFNTAPTTPLYKEETADEVPFFHSSSSSSDSRHKLQRCNSVPVSSSSSQQDPRNHPVVHDHLHHHVQQPEELGEEVSDKLNGSSETFRRIGSCESGFFSVGDNERVSTNDLSPEPCFEDPLVASVDGELNLKNAKNSNICNINNNNNSSTTNVLSDYSSCISSSSSSSSSSFPSPNFVNRRPVLHQSPRPVSCPRITCSIDDMNGSLESKSVSDEGHDDDEGEHNEQSQTISNRSSQSESNKTNLNPVVMEMKQILVPNTCHQLSSSSTS